MECLNASRGLGLALRDYQQALLDSILASLGPKRRVLAQLPTGGGKTVIFCALARIFAKDRGRRVLILVHRKELARQVEAALAREGLEYGVVLAGRRMNMNRPVQLATVQSMRSKIRYAHNFGLVIIDEAHHATAKSYQAILDACKGARVVGVTATPCRADGVGLGAAGYTSLICGPSVQWLVGRGHLAPALVFAPDTIDVSGVEVNRGDFVRERLAEVCDRRQITGSAIEHYRRHADRMPAIAFCVSVKHAEHVASQFREAGYLSESIDGTMGDDQRADLIDRLAQGALHVLTSCDLISEGVDVPVVACGIMLRPTLSLALWIQQAGRCFRPAPGKAKAIILDHAGNTIRHGLPTDEYQWSLESRQPKASGARQGVVSVLRVCPSCRHAQRSPGRCEQCGAALGGPSDLPSEKEGELRLVSEADGDWCWPGNMVRLVVSEGRRGGLERKAPIARKPMRKFGVFPEWSDKPRYWRLRVGGRTYFVGTTTTAWTKYIYDFLKNEWGDRIIDPEDREMVDMVNRAKEAARTEGLSRGKHRFPGEFPVWPKDKEHWRFCVGYRSYFNFYKKSPYSQFVYRYVEEAWGERDKNPTSEEIERWFACAKEAYSGPAEPGVVSG